MVHQQGLKNRLCHKDWTYRKVSINKGSNCINGPQLKVKNQIMAYFWTFGKDPLKLEKIL